MSVVMATAAAVVLATVNHLVDPRPVPASVPAMAGVLALVLMAGVRYVWRLALDRRRRPSGDACAKLLVFGAGEGGVQVVAALLKDPDSPYLPVGLLDDDRPSASSASWAFRSWATAPVSRRRRRRRAPAPCSSPSRAPAPS